MKVLFAQAMAVPGTVGLAADSRSESMPFPVPIGTVLGENPDEGEGVEDPFQ